jgi:hypothetical protein
MKGDIKMTSDAKQKWQTIMDREMLMINSDGCPACGRKFTLGDPVVSAQGPWGEEPALIHASEAVFDPKIQMYVEREWYAAGRYT